MAAFSALEQQILAKMTQGDRERQIMERQIAAAKVSEREYTDHGFFTTQCFTDHPDLMAGASFILWIKDGRLVTLEGFTNEGFWQNNEVAFRVAATDLG